MRRRNWGDRAAAWLPRGLEALMEACDPAMTYLLPLQLIAAGIVKFWLSPGRGGFGLSPSECIEPSFYALATSENCRPYDRTICRTAIASPILPKPAPLSTCKSTNYLPNALALQHAKETGSDVVSIEPKLHACTLRGCSEGSPSARTVLT